VCYLLFNFLSFTELAPSNLLTRKLNENHDKNNKQLKRRFYNQNSNKIKKGLDDKHIKTSD
jgi:hypothetical protein